MKYFLTFLFTFVCVAVSAQNVKTYTYAIKAADNLKMDVYTPINITKEEKLPVLLWMHGGGFSGGKRDNGAEVKMMKQFATKGYIAISISYRLLRKGEKTGFGCNCPKQEKLETFKQAAIDYLDAAKFIVDHQKELQIDVTKIIAGGSSAGAEGILNAVFMKEFFAENLQKYENVNFAGVFSLAGALVNANYITAKNAIPSVFFHGTEDNLVPFSTAPHHYCSPEKPGYLILDGSETIVKKLDKLNTSNYFHKVIGGRHELSSIPFEELNNVISFFEKTVFNSEVIQTKKIITKKK